MPSLVTLSVLALAGSLCAPLLALAALAWWARRFWFPRRTLPYKCAVAFFHPYCNAGGGGERVLWCAIEHLLVTQDPSIFEIVIYCGDADVSREAMLESARRRFGLSLVDRAESLRIVYVASRGLLEAVRYPRFTMLGQSLGSMAVAWECLSTFTPDVWVDTTGYAFTLPVAKLIAGCRTASYVHYPTITGDMLRRVHERRPTYNNGSWISGSAGATLAKLAYYRAFAWLYGCAGGFSDAVMANSSWTKGHLDGLWALPAARLGGSARATGGGGGDEMTPAALRREFGGAGASAGDPDSGESDKAAAAEPAPESGGLLRLRRPENSSVSSIAGAETPLASPFVDASRPVVDCAAVAVDGILPSLWRALGLPGAPARPSSHVVFPPCNTDDFAALPLAGPRSRIVVSVAQFRPEKAHALQLEAFADFRKRGGGERFSDVRLHLIGGVRDAGDEARVAELKALADRLGIADAVVWRTNIPIAELRAALGSATAGLHTMWNEHFGIGVVEMMAAGVITIAHNSGGPRADIVVRFRGTPTGLLAAEASEYADALEAVFTPGALPLRAMAGAARASVARFSDGEFQLQFTACLIRLLTDGRAMALARRACGAGGSP